MAVFTRRLAALLLSAACTGSLLLLVPGSSSAAAAAPAVSRASAIAGESVRVAGRVSAKKARPVALQIGRAGRWTTVARSRTTAVGGYAFTTRMPAARSLVRVYAPKATYKVKKKGKKRTKTMAAVTTGARTLAPLAQRGWVTTAGVPLYQAVNAAATTGARPSVPLEATFVPVRPGRVVALQRLAGGVWRNVGMTARQNSRGSAVFGVPDATHYYRAVALSSAGAAAVGSTSASTRPRSVMFEDDFNGSSLDPSKWKTRQPGVVLPSRNASVPDTSMAKVTGGALELRVGQTPCRNDTKDSEGKSKSMVGVADKSGVKRCFLNGQVGTDVSQSPFAFRYGVMAARIKFQRGQGQHGAFWSQPLGVSDADRKSGDPRRAGAEIDTVENFGDNYTKGGLGHYIHTTTKVGGLVDTRHLLGSRRAWSSDYHVYSVQWSPKGYVFRIDGRRVYSTNQEVSGRDQALILSLLTSDWELKRLDSSPPKLEADPMRVDWVRVWGE